MKNEAKQWYDYAEENLETSMVLAEHELFNPCLQNCQQAIEKYLKSIMLELELSIERTHSIQRLVQILAEKNIQIPIADDEIELIDSIYLPSKYPLGSVLPFFEPDKEICDKCVDIAGKIEVFTIDYFKL